MLKLRQVLFVILFPFILFAQQNSQMEVIGEYNGTLPANIKYNTALNGYIYIVGDDKIFIYDLTDQDSPLYVKAVTHANARKVWGGDNNILAVYDGDKISIYDISGAENPVKKSDYTAGEDLVHVKIAGTYMYVLYMHEYTYNKVGLFEIVDISNTTAPVLTDTFNPGNMDGYYFTLNTDHTRAYTAHFSTATQQTVIHELDISDPTDIQDLKTVNISKTTFGMALYGEYMFLLQSDGWNGPSYLRALKIVEGGDWTDYNPVQVSTSQAQDMHVQDNSLTLSLWDGGIIDYTFDSETNIFTEGESIAFGRASHMAMSVSQTNTGPTEFKAQRKGDEDYLWYYYVYYIMNNNAPATGMVSDYDGNKMIAVRKWIRIQIENRVFLTMGTNSLDAEAAGCSVLPAVGTHEYTRGEVVIIGATDNIDNGWVFEEWTGSVSGTEKAQIVIMNEDKTAIGNFKELKLVGAGSKTDITCICDFNNTETEMVTLSATAYGDSWIMTGITLNASGNGNDVTHLGNVRVMKGGVELWSANNYPINNGSLTATFAQAVTIAEGETQTFLINYTFSMTQSELEEESEALLFQVTGTPIATPENYETGPIIGSATGRKLMGMVYNTAQNMFMTINEAIADASTTNGSEVILCPGTFKEDVVIDKSITLRGEGANDQSIIEQGSTVDQYNRSSAVDIIADNVSIRSLMVRNSYIGIKIREKSNITIDNCRLVYNRYQGIQLYKTTGTTISNNIFVQTAASANAALSIETSATGLLINDNTFNNNYEGISISGADATCRIIGNTFYNTERSGIYTSNCIGLQIFSNTFDDVRMIGIQITDGSNCSAVNNTFNNSTNTISNEGIFLFGGDGHSAVSNKIYNYYVGIVCRNTTNTKIEYNEAHNANFSYRFDNDSGFTFNNNYGSGGRWGVELESSTNFRIISNTLNDYQSRVYLWGGYGIYFEDSNNNGYIYGNQMINNCSGIKFMGDDNENIRIVGNNISSNICIMTGLNISGADNIDVIGNNFSGNEGAAIMSETSSGITITSNNIIDNDAGVINNNASAIVADNNYWGDDQPGAEDIQGDVTINDWLTDPVSLIAYFEYDTKLVSPGESDTLLLVVQNLNNPDDDVTVTLSDENNWLIGNLNLNGAMSDSTAKVFKIPYTVPTGAGDNTTNRIYADVNSTITAGLTTADTTVFTTYIQELETLAISQDSATIAKGDDYQFTYTAFDQNGKAIAINPNWTTDAGTISASGLLTTTNINGEVTVTLTDPVTTKTASVTCYVTDQDEQLQTIQLTPAVITCDQGDDIQFTAVGYNQFGFIMDFVKQWSASVGIIREDGYYIASGSATDVTITVSDTNQTVIAAANIIVENITEVDEAPEIPTDYSLAQNYPNPFNPSTTIEYRLKEEGEVTLKIFNVLGQLVDTIVNKWQNAGTHNVVWNASKYASGAYFLHMNVSSGGGKEKYNTVRKMILIK